MVVPLLPIFKMSRFSSGKKLGNLWLSFQWRILININTYYYYRNVCSYPQPLLSGVLEIQPSPWLGWCGWMEKKRIVKETPIILLIHHSPSHSFKTKSSSHSRQKFSYTFLHLWYNSTLWVHSPDDQRCSNHSKCERSILKQLEINTFHQLSKEMSRSDSWSQKWSRNRSWQRRP